MSKYCFDIRNSLTQRKILKERARLKRLLIKRALAAEAQPWSVARIAFLMSIYKDKREKRDFFNDNISHIFPTILDLSYQGVGIASIERQMNLTSRMLWRWLENKPALMEAVREARRVGAVGRAGKDGVLPPDEI